LMFSIRKKRTGAERCFKWLLIWYTCHNGSPRRSYIGSWRYCCCSIKEHLNSSAFNNPVRGDLLFLLIDSFFYFIYFILFKPHHYCEMEFKTFAFLRLLDWLDLFIISTFVCSE
jgi:hypothetical protein